MIEYKTKDGRVCKGVATNWLLNKAITDDLKPRVPIYVRKSQFRLPFKFQTPIIMIGPGTGLAPFRGFIQERDFYRKEGTPLSYQPKQNKYKSSLRVHLGRQVGDSILYYGCRKKAEDFLYENELSEYESNGTLSKLNVAFSRDQDQKVYVQHLLQRDAESVWNLIKEGGHIYVCG